MSRIVGPISSTVYYRQPIHEEVLVTRIVQLVQRGYFQVALRLCEQLAVYDVFRWDDVNNWEKIGERLSLPIGAAANEWQVRRHIEFLGQQDNRTHRACLTLILMP